MGATELKVIGKLRRQIGDDVVGAYRYTTVDLWLYLRDAVEAVGVDTEEVWEPTTISGDADFTVSPVIGIQEEGLIVAKMAALIAEREVKRGHYDGMGASIKSGPLQSIDTKKIADGLQKRYESAIEAYSDVLFAYMDKQDNYQSKDLYTQYSGTIKAN